MAPPDPAAMGKVAVLFGGRSAEREISLRSGGGVLAALRRKGVDAHAFDPADRPMDDLRREGFERVFIALHGRYGEDGTVQGALELLRIPYTGSGVLASAIAMDKVRTKEIWTARGLSTPPSMVLRRGDVLREVPDHLGLPLIMKPPHEGSTLGVSKVMGYSDVNEAFETAARYDEDREALRAIGIDLDKVREAVRGKFGDDLAEGWGGRGGRSRKGGRGGRGGCGEGHRGPRHPRSAGYGPDAFGPGGFGPGGFGPGFGPGGPRGPQEFADCADTGEQGDRRSGGRGRRGPGGDAPWEGGRGRRGPRGRGGRPRWDADVRSALRAAVDVARERGDRTLTAAHLLIGIIDTADDASRAVLTTATVPVDDLRRAVLDSLPPVGAPA